METRARYQDLLREHPAIPAPMCGISDYPQRELSRRAGAAFTFTYMISGENIARMLDGRTAETRELEPAARAAFARRHAAEYLDLGEAEAPLGIQLFGSDPADLAAAAAVLVELGAAVIDLNMGCPARKITNCRAGAALLRDLPRAGVIFRAMRAAIPIPFTAKMRWDWDHDGGAALEVARMAEAEGLDGLCLHARTREQGYSGAADWDAIARLKEAVALPVVGNGDIRSPADALAMRRHTGCDAVMLGRAIMGAPWLIGEVTDALRSGRADETGEIDWARRRAVMLQHAAMMFARQGPRGIVHFRKHAACYLRGVRGAKRLRERLVRVSSLEELGDLLPEEVPVA